MTSMDFGIPDLSAGRDHAPDASRRHGKSDTSDFSALLDRVVDEPGEPPRDSAEDKAPTANAGEKTREKPRAEHAAKDAGRHKDEADYSKSATETQSAQDPAQPTDSEPRPEPTEAQAAAEPGADQDGANTTATTVSDQDTDTDAANTQIASAPTQAVNTADVPKAPKPAIDGTLAALGGAPELTPDAAPVDATGNAPKIAEPPNARTAAAAAGEFAEQLAAATAKPTEAGTAKGKPKSEAAQASDAAAKQPNAASPSASTIVVPAAATPDTHPQRDPANGNPAQHPAAPAQPAGQQASAPQAAPTLSVPPAATSPAPSADATAADDEPLLAVLRAANPQAQPVTRAADSKPAEPPAFAEGALKDVEIESRPGAEPAKGEAPSKPFGALAPGLGLAAQITAQQTPEQANAADRLAQLAAAATEAKGSEALPKPVDVSKPVEAAAPAQIDQSAPVDAPAQRQAVADAAAANAARSARPNQHPIVTQVAAQVAQAAADGADRINIRLSPAELGRIDVKLDFGPDGRVQAVFAAERPQTMELLQRDARDLERALQDAGLRADSGSLSFNLRGQGRDSQGEQTPNGGRQDGAPAELVAAQLQAYSAGANGSGRLDIRI